MTKIELAQLRSRFIGSPLFQLIPETPEGSFEALAIFALDYADEQKVRVECVDELCTSALEQARELKALLTRQIEFLKSKSSKADRLEWAAKIEEELLEYQSV